MRALFFQIEVPWPPVDKTGRRSRTGPLTLHMIEQGKRNNGQQAEIRALRAELAKRSLPSDLSTKRY